MYNDQCEIFNLTFKHAKKGTKKKIKTKLALSLSKNYPEINFSLSDLHQKERNSLGEDWLVKP